MKRNTVYMLHADMKNHTVSAVPERGYEDLYNSSVFSFIVCYARYGQGWKSAVGGVMCVSERTLGACIDRTSAAIADMIARGRMAELLAVQMVLGDILQEYGGQVTRRRYDALCEKYREIAEGMLNA